MRSLASLLRFALPLMSVVPLLGGCASGASDDTATGAESALSGGHANTVSFDDFAKAVNGSNITKDMTGDCSFSSSPTSTGLELKVVSSDGTVTLAISRSDRITLKSKNEQSTYTIAGVGAVEILNADDAFDRVTVRSTSKSASCEVDF